MMLSGLAGFAVRAAIAIIAYKLADKTLLFYDEPLAWIRSSHIPGNRVFLSHAENNLGPARFNGIILK